MSRRVQTGACDAPAIAFVAVLDWSGDIMIRRYGQRACERRQWVRFAWIGEHDGALRVNTTGAASNDLTVEEINAACNCTIILSRMVRKGRNEWVKRLWDNIKRSKRP